SSRSGTKCSAGAISGGGTVAPGSIGFGYSSIVYDPITQAEGGYFSSLQIDQLAVDWAHDRAFFVTSAQDKTLPGLRRLRLATMVENKQVRSIDLDTDPNGFLTGFTVDSSGYWYANTGSTSNEQPMARVDPISMIQVGLFGFHASLATHGQTTF